MPILSAGPFGHGLQKTLLNDYATATEFTHDWANLTGWTASHVQVNGNRLFSDGTGTNPSATEKAFAVAAGETVKVTAEIVAPAGGTVGRIMVVGVDFNGGVVTASPGLVAVGVTGTSNVPCFFVGSNFTGITTGTQTLTSGTFSGTFRAIVTIDSENISLVLRKADGSAEWGTMIARSHAPNAGAATAVMGFNNDTRALTGNYVKAIGAKKSLTPFRTQSNAAGTIEGNTGLVIYRNVSDKWRIHLPAGLDPHKPAPICVFCHMSGSAGHFNTPIADSRCVNIDQALDTGGYIIVSAEDGPERWGNQASLDNYSNLMEWIKARVYCGKVVMLGVSMGGAPVWNALLRGDINPAAVAGICPVCDLDNMEANATFTSSVRAAYSAADHATYLTNSVGYNPIATSNLARFAGKGVKFYCASSGDTTVPNADHVDVFKPLIAPYAASVTEVQSGTAHDDASLFQGTDLVSFFNGYV